MREEERERIVADAVTEFFRSVPAICKALTKVLIALIVCWAIVNTARALAGKETNARFQVLVEMKFTRELAMTAPLVLGGAGVVYVRRRKKLHAQGSGLIETAGAPFEDSKELANVNAEREKS